MLTYPLTVTEAMELNIAAVDWNAVTQTGATESIFTLQEEIFEHPGTRLACTVTLNIMSEAEARAWIYTLLSLYGQSGTILFGDPGYTGPAGNLDGSEPLVDGAGQAFAKTLAVEGLAAGQSGVLLPGDQFQLGEGTDAHVYHVLKEVDADSIGEAPVEIFPRIRAALLNEQPLILDNPVGVFRLAGRSQSWRIDEAQLRTLSFSLVEAI
ncbi:MAG: hypothetical protein WD407_04450 [Rhodospirillales bacterium]